MHAPHHVPCRAFKEAEALGELQCTLKGSRCDVAVGIDAGMQ